jgi:hypothetical protein
MDCRQHGAVTDGPLRAFDPTATRRGLPLLGHWALRPPIDELVHKPDAPLVAASCEDLGRPNEVQGECADQSGGHSGGKRNAQSYCRSLHSGPAEPRGSIVNRYEDEQQD